MAESSKKPRQAKPKKKPRYRPGSRKGVGGRRSKWKPELCELLLEYARTEGLSFEAFPGWLDERGEYISLSRLYEYAKQYPEFQEAKDRAEAIARRRWERIGREAALGQIGEFKAAAWVFSMKNRFGWKDRREVSGPDDGPVTVEVRRKTIQKALADPEVAEAARVLSEALSDDEAAE